MKKITQLGIAIILIGFVSLIIIKSNIEKGDVRTPDQYVVDMDDMYTVGPVDEGMASDQITSKEKDWLIHMREEEKLARDVYIKLGNVWGARVFTNIAASEQTHTDSIKVLLDRHSVTDPVKDDKVGVFTLPEMQKLYSELTAKGSLSLLDAFVVGATIEDLDIRDIDMALAESDNLDIKTVYNNLQKGSRNHMRAFIKNITQQGGVYKPRYISDKDYQDIISAPQEKGKVM